MPIGFFGPGRNAVPDDRRHLLIVLALTLSSSTNAQVTERAPGRPFHSDLYGYSLVYPSEWTFQGRSGHFYIENFSPAKAVNAVRLPRGGASINVTVLKELTRSKEMRPNLTFEAFVTLGTSNRTVETRRTFEITETLQTMTITEVKTRCCAVAPFQTSLDWYFLVEGRMFTTNLQYWASEPSPDYLARVMRRIVLSIIVNRR